jgi:hypothetical protein
MTDDRRQMTEVRASEVGGQQITKQKLKKSSLALSPSKLGSLEPQGTQRFNNRYWLLVVGKIQKNA